MNENLKNKIIINRDNYKTVKKLYLLNLKTCKHFTNNIMYTKPHYIYVQSIQSIWESQKYILKSSQMETLGHGAQGLTCDLEDL